jgi:hypothetical protein
MSKLFVVEGGRTKVLENQNFDNEKLLQDVLEKFPEFIALDDLGAAEPFMVIGREVATPAGYIDVLCIDGEGILTVIETKLARNSQIRREVIGQVLEYVAQVSKWSVHDVLMVASKYFQSPNIDGDHRKLSLLEKLASVDDGDITADDIYEKIESNLRKGLIKVIIASDTIPDTLRDTVIFINSFSNFDIYVLQVQAFVKDGLQIYAPTIFGLTRKAGRDVNTESFLWSEESFFNAISHFDQEAVDVIKDLYEFSKENAYQVRWGRGKVIGSFSFVVKVGEKIFTVFSVYTSGEAGHISFSFGNMTDVFSNEKLSNFRNELNRLPGVNLTEEVVFGGKYPSIKIEPGLKKEESDSFKNAVLALISGE